MNWLAGLLELAGWLEMAVWSLAWLHSELAGWFAGTGCLAGNGCLELSMVLTGCSEAAVYSKARSHLLPPGRWARDGLVVVGGGE